VVQQVYFGAPIKACLPKYLIKTLELAIKLQSRISKNIPPGFGKNSTKTKGAKQASVERQRIAC
jgi:hypothetical protein